MIALLILLGVLAGCAAGPAPKPPAVPAAWRGHAVVLLPFENLSAESVPAAEMREYMAERLRGMGFTVRDEATLLAFMRARRLRYTGGLDEDTARAFGQENLASLVLITSVELYKPSPAPRVALICRAVSTEENPRVFWMDRFAMAGNERPGLLALGVVRDEAALWGRAVDTLASSLGRHLAGKGVGPERRDRPIKPRLVYRSPELEPDRKIRVAVLPFMSRTRRRNAGEVLALHFVNQFAKNPSFSVIEPGAIRQRLLRFRVIMTEGVTLNEVNSLANSLEADLVVTGKVWDYEDGGDPKVEFSVQAIDGRTRKTVWSSESYRKGRDGVFFYDWGAFWTASSLAAGMAEAIAEGIPGPGQS